MFKKIIIFLAAVVLFTGCTTIESTQKFNAVNLGTAEEKAVCQTLVEMDGYYFLGLPIIVGSAKGDGKFALFRRNLTNENVVFLLTQTVKKYGANRMINVQVNASSAPTLFPFVTYRHIQGSATGLRNKQAAMRQMRQEFDGIR